MIYLKDGLLRNKVSSITGHVKNVSQKAKAGSKLSSFYFTVV